ncbi:nucleotidyltransferase family protein [Lentzea nigeriaca]|uniref:hypothetical protein n=1 Tax=Lentzea nigeriaca TaxID=1128665 RepID=UPI00195E4289|nr:hypothetical protein [Lentzea nigeriaca]MBM7864275.1 hypothetical protein [Lentzea nigeriaca]
MTTDDAVRSRFSPVRPLLAGDVINGDKVAGFAWSSRGGDVPSTHLDDKLVLVGEEGLDSPPERGVPQSCDGAEACALMPPDDLSADQVRSAAALEPTLPHRVEALLDLPGAAWQPVARVLFASVHATGHRLWLAGGVVRDLVSGVPERQINDLDLSGTVPAGRFSDILYQSRRMTRMSEFRQTVTPGSLVCAVTAPGSKERLIEYRGLSVTGFRFPAVGSSLVEDVRTRDFTFNALFYDLGNHDVLDPCGSGVDDLLADERKFVALKATGDAFAQAEVLVRALKFAMRWKDLPAPDVSGLNSWLSRVSPHLCQVLTSKQWRKLTDMYRTNVSLEADEHRRFTERLVQPGRDLLMTLIGGAK